MRYPGCAEVLVVVVRTMGDWQQVDNVIPRVFARTHQVMTSSVRLMPRCRRAHQRATDEMAV